MPSLVTSSSLCTFDYDTSTPANDFRLLFTPTVGAPSYKLNATNPGQFYYNIFYSNETDHAVTPVVEITLPYPFITQGAVPVHAYSGVIVKSTNGQYCLTPQNEIFNTKQAIVTLADYPPSPIVGVTTNTIYVTLPEIPAGGFVYTNIHLDYGLKGTLGYGKDGYNNAIQFGTSPAVILIKDGQTYGFEDNLGLSHTVQSMNVFKKNPEIGGGAKNNLENPKGNAKVMIYQGTKLMSTVYTDIDGWYMWPYKYTGKPTTFTIKLSEFGLSKSITLKSNGYVQVDFVTP